VSKQRIYYDDADYARWMAGGPAPTPRYYEEETPVHQVRSRDTDETPRGPALFSRRELAKQQTATERFVALLLLLVSFVGIVLFGGGGVARWLALTPNLIGGASALAIQVVCTRVQWVYAAQRWHSPWWLAAFAVSASGTLLGFWPLTHAPVTVVLQWAQVPAATAPWFAGALLVIGAGLLDYLPEQILTD
jgi:hypothetical protein